MQCSAHIGKNAQQPLDLADTIAITTLFLDVCVPFQKKKNIYIMHVFPKWCEQAALCVGFLLANVSNWPWETDHLLTLCCYINNGCFPCFCVYACVCLEACRCVFQTVCVSSCTHLRRRVSVWVYSCNSVPASTAFIHINMKMCLSCSPSYPCPLVQSVQGRPLSSHFDCQWTWRKVR